MDTVGIIGCGRVGTAMAVSLARSGYQVQVLRRDRQVLKAGAIGEKEFATASLEKIVQETEVIFITTPDDVIASIIAQLVPIAIKSLAVLHMSGSLSSEILEPLKNKGIMVGSLHPLQSFSTIDQAVENLPGSAFSYEGDPALLLWVSRLVEKLQGNLITLPSPQAKVVYHAGAVFVSNYLIALAQLGTECLQQAGFSGDEALKALLPLMKGTINNLSNQSPGQALTGPISRGDTGVIQLHLKALECFLPEALPVYCALAPQLVKLAHESGKISQEKYRELMLLLSNSKNIH